MTHLFMGLAGDVEWIHKGQSQGLVRILFAQTENEKILVDPAEHSPVKQVADAPNIFLESVLSQPDTILLIRASISSL